MRPQFPVVLISACLFYINALIFTPYNSVQRARDVVYDAVILHFPSITQQASPFEFAMGLFVFITD